MDALSVNARIHSRISDWNPRCGLCLNHNESLMHLFTRCPVSVHAWNISGIPSQWPLSEDLGFLEWWVSLMNLLGSGEGFERKRTLVILMLWVIWEGRNDRVFNGVSTTAIGMVRRATSLHEDILLIS